ncbi:5-carboxymethyl-2-hydroxymuconate Delta-isomerase [Pseudomonas entomophila]|uniref:5-carboxymethyl-2-hydroxymuconate Delta-isomerase n=1 Tax=Pseudomonas entomophila TaxID=312306 RepID=UPI003EB72C98
MPHLNLDYSANLTHLNVDVLLLRLNQALVASGQFADELDIKSRAQAVTHFRVGTSPLPRGFAHVRLAIMAGRHPLVKKQLTSALLDVLRDSIGPSAEVDVQFSVELHELDPQTYVKLHLPAH